MRQAADDLLVRGVGACAMTEVVRGWCRGTGGFPASTKPSMRPQIRRCSRALYRPSRRRAPARSSRVPEAHEELQEGGLARCRCGRRCRSTADAPGPSTETLSDRIVCAAVGERDARSACRAREHAGLGRARHLGDGGCLVEEVEDAVAGGKACFAAMPPSAGERDGRPEGTRSCATARDEQPGERVTARARQSAGEAQRAWRGQTAG